MTACQIVEEIEAVGGVLRLEGDRVRCNIPTSARALVEVARAHRDHIRALLRQRLEAARPVVLWVATRCAKAPGAWSAERFLYREYREWCFAEGRAAVSIETIRAILSDGFARSGDGWYGLCLGVDFFAAFPGAERYNRDSGHKIDPLNYKLAACTMMPLDVKVYRANLLIAFLAAHQRPYAPRSSLCRGA